MSGSSDKFRAWHLTTCIIVALHPGADSIPIALALVPGGDIAVDPATALCIFPDAVGQPFRVAEGRSARCLRGVAGLLAGPSSALPAREGRAVERRILEVRAVVWDVVHSGRRPLGGVVVRDAQGSPVLSYSATRSVARLSLRAPHIVAKILAHSPRNKRPRPASTGFARQCNGSLK